MDSAASLCTELTLTAHTAVAQAGTAGKKGGFGSSQTWVLIPGLPLTSCEAVDKLLSLSEP